MSLIATLLAAEHDLALLHGCHVTDRPDLENAPHWIIDHAKTLAAIRDALAAIGVSTDTGHECTSCRNRPLRTHA